MKQRPVLLSAIAVFSAAAATVTNHDGRRWWSYVQYLASDQMRGRDTGSPEHRKAAGWVAAQFEKAGLEPAGTQGYLQPVKLISRRVLQDQSTLALVRNGKAEPMVIGEDAIISARGEPADSTEASAVFVGYGLAIPELRYDDLAGLDLKGKLAVVLFQGPPNVPSNLSSHYQSNAERWKRLKAAGAIGIVSVLNPKHMDLPWDRIKLARFQPAMMLADPALQDTAGMRLSVLFNPERTEKLFAGSGHTFQELLAAADAGKALPRFALPGSVRATVRSERKELESQNVAGVLRGSDPALRNEYVVLSAHLDHVGVGKPINGDPIYNGAMDNASGVASLLDVAASLHDANAKLKRSLLFLAVTAEEKGLLGSRYFATHPTVSAKSIVADVNFDMFLPIVPLRVLTVYGLNESDLGDSIRAAAAPLGIAVDGDPHPERNVFIRSDQYNFIREGVPSLSFKIGYKPGSPEQAVFEKWIHDRYHAPSDDLNQPVDLQAAAGFDSLMLRLAEAVANRPERPHWRANSFFRRFQHP